MDVAEYIFVLVQDEFVAEGPPKEIQNNNNALVIRLF